MAKIYRSGQPLPELALVIRGATTIVLSTPDELEGLQSLCLVVSRSQPDPTASIFRALGNIRATDLSYWAAERARSDLQRRHWQEVTPTDLEQDSVQEIVAALGLAQAVWKNQSGDIQNLVLTLSIADPGYKPEPLIDIQGSNPGWLLYHGSLRSRLFLGTFKAGGFVVGLFSRGIGVEDRANKIVEELRKKQLEKIPEVKNLPRIDQMKEGELADKCCVIVFLHGLLSTDLGTFDALIDFLREHGLKEDKFAFVGWPHNTLTRIEFNAEKLCQHIEDALGATVNAPPRLAFVCHSRGGLLARYAAATLFQRDLQRWETIIRGCVTFGTPHLGTGLADAPDELIASFIAAGAWRESGTLAALNDVLWVAKTNEVLEGVEDLRTLEGKLPGRNREPFQRTLADKERAADIGKQRKLSVLTIGGRIGKPAKWYYDVAGRALGGVEHDVAVPLSSSLPHGRFGREPPTNCDHFSYFSSEELNKPHYVKVADYLKDVLDWNDCEQRHPPEPPPASKQIQITHKGKYVLIGDVPIRKKKLPKLKSE